MSLLLLDVPDSASNTFCITHTGWSKNWHTYCTRHIWGVVGSLVIVLLQIFSWFWQWIKFEVIRRTKIVSILGHPAGEVDN